MKVKILLIIALLLSLVCCGIVLLFGSSYTVTVTEQFLQSPIPGNPDDISVGFIGDPTVECTGVRVENGRLFISFHALTPGKSTVLLYFNGIEQIYLNLYVHPFNIMTYDSYFGDFTGSQAIPLAVLAYLILLLWSVIRNYRNGTRACLYQYRNVLRFGLAVFLGFLILYQIPLLFSYEGPIHSIKRMLSSVHIFSSVALPVAFVMSVLITVSNVNLMRKEGRNWRNMLGTILGAGLCLLTLLPFALGEYLQRSTLVDVHNEQGAALYIEHFTEAFISAVVTYLECVLIGTIFIGVKSARHMPSYDQDYVLILGCQIMKDGSLTPLLRSRADKALEFARRQKEKTGKEIVFVPSGGQGPDEVMAEADAIADYLRSVGVPEERILPENRSVNTYENIRNSMKLIRENAGAEKPHVIFSTTNYHVFRSGMIAWEQGERLEGIGSPTKRYFWINAFVREFIATLVSERKRHLAVTLTMAVMIAAMVIVEYLSATL